VDSFVISAGERYDVVLNASQQISNYWIRLHGLMDCAVTEVFQAAILQYNGASGDEPEDKLTYENTERQGKVVHETWVSTLKPPSYQIIRGHKHT